MIHIRGIKNIGTTNYKWLFCIGIISLFFTEIFAQTATTKIQSFEYIDPLKPGKISNGSFRYKFIVKENNQDLLKKKTADFTDLSKEIRIIISDLELENYDDSERTLDNEIALYFNNEWRSYENKLKPIPPTTTKLVPNNTREKNIKFRVVEDGKIWIKIGYHTKKELTTSEPFYLKLEFTAIGTGKKAPAPVVEKEDVMTSSDVTQPPKTETPPPAKSKNKNKPKLSEEEEAWKATVKKDSRGAYERFIKNFPESKHIEEAKAVIEQKREKEPVNIRINQEGNIFTVILENTKNPVIIDSLLDSLGVEVRYNYESIEIELPPLKQKYTFYAKDDWGKSIPPINIDAETAPLKAKLTTEEDFLKIIVEGGLPPYSLVIRNEIDEVVKRYNKFPVSKGEQITVEIPYGELGNKLNGIYTIDLDDSRKTISKRFEDIIIEQKGSIISPKVLMVLGGLFLLILIAFLNRSYQKKKEKQQQLAKEKLQANKTTTTTTTNMATSRKESTTRRSFKAKNIKKVEPKIVAPLTNSERPPMKIRKRNQGTLRIGGKLSNAEFTELVNGPGQYVVVNLGGTWGDSAVSDVYLSKQCVKDIDNFIRTTNQIAKEETDDSPPEIGGFLLGSYSFFKDKNQYEISVDKFVSITPEENNVYTVAFGTQAWSKLDDIVVKSGKKADLIGWFHTHPGHGLFLSQPDLKIHNGFFTQKHKVAIEIDTLTPDFDTAFFTRKQDGEVNNTRNRITNEWHYWTNIERITRKS